MIVLINYNQISINYEKFDTKFEFIKNNNFLVVSDFIHISDELITQLLTFLKISEWVFK
jgi:hypothetical protein